MKYKVGDKVLVEMEIRAIDESEWYDCKFDGGRLAYVPKRSVVGYQIDCIPEEKPLFEVNQIVWSIDKYDNLRKFEIKTIHQNKYLIVNKDHELAYWREWTKIFPENIFDEENEDRNEKYPISIDGWFPRAGDEVEFLLRDEWRTGYRIESIEENNVFPFKLSLIGSSFSVNSSILGIRKPQNHSEKTFTNKYTVGQYVDAYVPADTWQPGKIASVNLDTYNVDLDSGEKLTNVLEENIMSSVPL